MALDQVDQAIISQALIAAAKEMGIKLVRSAYSPIVREANDCSAALLDVEGNVVSQAELIPMQLGPIGTTFRPCAELHPPETLEPGDFYINNDPFPGRPARSRRVHLLAHFLRAPTGGFQRDGGPPPRPGRRRAGPQHGGGRRAPGGAHLSAEPLQPEPGLESAGLSSASCVRTSAFPRRTIGDCNAQFAANAVGARRVVELCEKFGADAVMEAMAALLDYSEQRMRAAIADAPDGVYPRGGPARRGRGERRAPRGARAGGDRRRRRFRWTTREPAGRSERTSTVPSPRRSRRGLSCVKSVLTSPDIPFNEGSKRPIHIACGLTVPLLNPRPPAPVRARMLSAYRAYNAVMKALAKAVPEQVMAAGFDTTHSTCLSHLGDGGYGIYLEIFGGGYGASAVGDGCDAVDSPLSNCSNIPIEAIDMEHEYFRVTEYALVPGSGGSGEHRGGLGMRRVYEVLADDVEYQSYSDRFAIPPEGLFGGEEGGAAFTCVLRGNEKIMLDSKTSFRLVKGDRLVMSTGGGAGYGEPGRRAPERVERDRAAGALSPGR